MNRNQTHCRRGELSELEKQRMSFFAFSATIITGYLITHVPWDVLFEVCSTKCIPSDINGLRADFEENVFGQHIAKEYVISALEHHISSESPKALALHFYGPTGTGKNLVTSYIAKNFFREGTKSRFYHYFNGMTDFSDSGKVVKYRNDLKAKVQRANSLCKDNIFVFDEVDKITPGVLDALIPYIDSDRPMNGIDYRNSIFIFLSNSSGEDLIRLTSEHLENGKKREDITLEDTLHLVKEEKIFENDGFKDSALKSFFKVNIPFLPLEKEHIKKCIRAELKARKWLATDDALKHVANELTYVPAGKEMFSSSGCRKVKVKMDIYIEEFLNKV